MNTPLLKEELTATQALPRLDMNLAAAEESLTEDMYLDLSFPADFAVANKLDLDISGTVDSNQELAVALARIAQLEDTLQQLRSTHTSLSHRFLTLQRVHVRALKENVRLENSRNNVMNFPQTVSEIISLRKQVTTLTGQLREAQGLANWWQARHQTQQQTIDDQARCIDQLQVALRDATASLSRNRQAT